MSTQIIKDRVSAQVHRLLRGKIMQGDLAEGTRLIEVDIASELGVSRTPVREALLQLRAMDLVRPLGNGGYEVADVRKELVDILEIRAALEAHAVRKAASRIEDAQIAHLATLCDRMEKLPFKATARRGEINRLFHEALIMACGNSRLGRLVSEYQDYFDVAQGLFDRNYVKRTEREHRLILNALMARDGERAAQLVTQHIAGAAEILGKERSAGKRGRTAKKGA
jgi:DNA-binding GntR family transcriptional regulator